ncbi:HAD-superfamily hydrolase [Trichodelitschia bisporula]|uniref:HAD-superfamily hydrolase n=1 Tax=Trichodelitschia bisporula TaxID=703511 RepID=A0A6G1HYX8_9PEZI|nr:HAD-superfamily hydrolase [Trichodelitschia bisporula]
MPLNPSSTPLTNFALLSFDVYGTLIDWERGASKALLSSAPIAALPSTHPLKDPAAILHALESSQRHIQSARPQTQYIDLLAEAYIALCTEHEISHPEVSAAGRAFAGSVGDWPAYPDTLDAMVRLKKYYKLVALTNSCPTTLGASLSSPVAFVGRPVFDATYTAAMIGAYKPNPRVFEFLLEKSKDDFGVKKWQVLHVARSLFHDHVTTGKTGIESVWVDRGGVTGGDSKDAEEANFGWEVKTLEELADLVDKEFAEEGR